VKGSTGDSIGFQTGRKNMAAMAWPDAWIAGVIALNGVWISVEIGPNVILTAKVIGLIDAWIVRAKGLTGDLIGAQIGPNVILIVEVSGLSGTWIAEGYAEVAKVVFTPGIVPTTGWQEPSIVACVMPGAMHAGKNSVGV